MKITIHNFLPFIFASLLWFVIGIFPQICVAQIVLDTAVVSNGVTIISASEENQTFTDNGLSGGLYYDDAVRSDTIVLCPENDFQQVKVTFNEFDISIGDTLLFYDCNLSDTTCVVKDKATGINVSAAYGGWLQANCAPLINTSGCTSFVFKTNGDQSKGTGWNATVTSENDVVTLKCPSNFSVIADCNNLQEMVDVLLPKPAGKECDGTTAMINLSSSCPNLNTLIGAAPVSADSSTLGTFPLPLGTYVVVAESIADTSKNCTYQITVEQPSIVCNDAINVSNGSYCPTSIGVDDILENPCVGVGVSYEISYSGFGTKDEFLTTTIDGTNFTTLSEGGIDISNLTFTCNQEFPITVTRIVSTTNCNGITSNIRKTCSSNIRFSLPEKPEIFFHPQSIISCENGLTSEEIISQLNFDVSCGVFDTVVTVESFPGNLCALNASAEVKIVATDVCGNTRSRRFDVLVVRPSRFFKPIDITIDCQTNYLPENTGYPFLDADNDGTRDTPIIGETCDFIASYKDHTTINDSIRMVSRVWTINDRCNLRVPVVLPPQHIQIKNSNPVFDCPNMDELGGQNNPIISYSSIEDCRATIDLTAPTATVGCGGSGNVIVVLNRVALVADTSIKYTSIHNVKLDIGAYFAEYKATDKEGGESVCQIFFSIKQEAGLDIICKDELNIAYVGSEIKVHVDRISGNNDLRSCIDFSESIRKDGSDWGTEISLNCEEVANETKVYLRIRDDEGNENTCSTIITGKDVSIPTCVVLEDLTYNCNQFHPEDFGLSTDSNNNGEFDDNEWEKLIGPLANIYNQEFGQPTCTDNLIACFNPLILQQYQLTPGQCGGAIIKRRFRALDESGNLSDWQEQTISLVVESDFSVTFPPDWVGICGDTFPEPSLVLNTKGCNILAWDSTDKLFNGIDGACTFIERTYSITNWCFYEIGQTAIDLTRIENENNLSEGLSVTEEGLATVGLFTYTQILKITDETAPIISIDPVDDCINDSTCEEEKIFSISGSDCSDDNLVYEYELKTKEGLIIANGNTSTFTAFVSNQKYEVKWTAKDNCGNTAWEVIDYEFKDCKSPSPYCFDGIATEINAQGITTIWASDITKSSSDNCSSENELEYRLYHPALGSSFIKPKGDDAAEIVLNLPQSLTLDCRYLGSQNVVLYVIDKVGNWSFCIGTILIQDNMQACGGQVTQTDMTTLSGKIETVNGTPLKEISIIAIDTSASEKVIQSDANGEFELSLSKDVSYTFSLEKEDEVLNGLTAFDIILVSKHILGLTKFDSPFQYIAADMNYSGSITAFDMVKMRQLILGIITPSSERNWQFVDSELSLDEILETTNGFIKPLNINTSADKIHLNLTGVKMGDLNGSVKINGLLSVDFRNDKVPLMIHLSNQKVKKGDLVTVPMQLDNLENFQGFQYGLNFEGLSLQTIKEGIITKNNFSINKAGDLSILWNKYDPTSRKNDNMLLELIFVAEKNGQLSDFISISNHFYSEAVDINDKLSNVSLHFEELSTSGFELFQNTPNPFSEYTDLSFQLDQFEEISLKVYSLQGDLLYEDRQHFSYGLHTIRLRKADLGTTGILIYQLKSGKEFLSKKMILLD